MPAHPECTFDDRKLWRLCCHCDFLTVALQLRGLGLFFLEEQVTMTICWETLPVSRNVNITSFRV
jgi:hypothetical protein